MKIKISGYKNLKNLDFEIEDKKINMIFGMSGCGKSSIANALKHVDLERNKTVNFYKRYNKNVHKWSFKNVRNWYWIGIIYLMDF